MQSDVHPLTEPIDFRRRAHLTEKMDEPCSRGELRACLRDIARLNNWFLANRQLVAWLDTFIPPIIAPPIHILDVGCGNGDTLRRIARWAQSRNLSVELTGLDINPDAIAIAAEATPSAIGIDWVASDIFAYSPDKTVHLIVSSLFTHHLDDTSVVQFLKWIDRHAELGWFVNDLSRAAIPYHFLRVFTRLARLHPFVQYDAPVSVARAFVSDDWRSFCSTADLNLDEVSIRGIKPAHLCVSRRKSQ